MAIQKHRPNLPFCRNGDDNSRWEKERKGERRRDGWIWDVLRARV
jgi:hypothetical protein